MKKMLVVYYSWANGNTKRVAEKLAEGTQADLVRIETVKPYKGSYSDVVSQGQQEVQNGFMPEIQPLNVDINEYDLIAVGTPTWWYTMAPAVHSFLHSQDWKGKTVIPFMTNGGWPGHVIRDMEKNCAGASFLLSLQVQFDSTGGDHMETPEKDVDAFVAEVKKLL
jgi:flavodoxin